MGLDATRVGTRTYLARNERGAEIVVGPKEVPGAFTPGELLQIALAACAGMSSDHRLAHALGDDFESTLEIGAVSVDGENRYERVNVDISVDTAALDEATLAHLRERAALLITKNCTVGRTLRAGADYAVTIDPTR